MAITRIKNNQITDASIVASSKLQDNSISAGKLANNLNYGSNLTITGNLTVNGTSTTLDTVNTLIEDPILLLAKDQTGAAAFDIGFVGERGDDTNIAWIWDEANDQFAAGFTSADGSANTITLSSYADARVADITMVNLAPSGNVTTALNADSTIEAGTSITAGTTVTATGNVSGGNLTTGGQVAADNADITNGITAGTTISATGNVSGGNVTTAGQVQGDNFDATNGITAGTTITATGNITGGNLITAGTFSAASISATGNVTGGNLVTSGAITDGTMTIDSGVQTGVVSIDASGNVDSGNVNTTLVDATTLTASGTVTGGTVTDGTLSINAGAVTGGTTADFSGNVDSGNVNTTLVDATTLTASGTVTGGTVTDGTLSINSGAITGATSGSFSTTLTATGNVTGGNVNTAGIVAATGNVSGGNLTTGGDIDASGDISGLTITSATFQGATPTIQSTGTDADITLNPNGTGSVDVSNAKITSLAEPTADSDAATKGYVDAVAEGLDPKGSVVASTTGALPANTYDNGSSGVGATLTGNANGALAAQDGVTLTTNDRLLVKDESAQANNGIYVLTTVGDGSNPYVLTRATDMDGSPTSEIPGAFTFVEEGTVNADAGFVCTTNAPVTMGTTAIVWAQFSGAGSIVAGDGLTKTGNELSVNVDGVTTAISADAVVVKASANLTTPNIGVANGDSLTVTGNVDGVSSNMSGVVVVTGNVSGGNLISGASITDGTYNSTDGVFTGVVSIDASGNIDSGNVNTTLVDATTLTASGTVTGGTLTDGTLSSTSGTITGGVAATFSGQIEGGTVTDGTLSINSGAVTGGTTASFSGNVSGGNLTTAGQVAADNVAATNGITAGTTIVATGNVSGGNVTTAGQVAADNADITNGITAGTTITATGNVSGGNVTTAGQVQGDNFDATNGITAGTTITATGNVAGGNLTTGGDVAATGAVSGASVTAGNVTINTDSIDSAGTAITLNTDSSDVDIIIENAAGNAYVKADAGASSVTIGENATATTDATLKVGGDKSIMIPVGATSDRPGTPVTGMIRFNTTLDSFEFYDSNSWTTAGSDFTVIASETFTGDNSTVAFTLGSSQTTASCIVSINGVVQIPTSAYGVSGTTLTFTEAPLAGDEIEVREITTTSTITQLSSADATSIIDTQDGGDVNIKGNIIPSANATYDLGSASERWNDLYLTGSTITLGNVVIKNTGGNAVGFFGPDGTTPGTIDANVEIAGDSIQSGTSLVDFTGVDGNVRINSGGVASILATTDGANVTGNLTATGNVAATYFLGDGSQLTGIDATAIQNGTTNVTTAANADITLTRGGTLTATVGTAGITMNNGAFVGDLTGTADDADALSSAVTVELTGPVTGSATFTNAGDTASIATTLTADPVITLTGAVTGSATMTNLGNVSITTTATSDPTITLAGDLTGSATLTNLGSATLTATIAANSVALGTDTTGNYVGAGATSGSGISGSVSSEGGTFTVTSNATSSNTGSTIVFRDGSGNFSAGVITATATAARYADLAEMYAADEAIEPGTVVHFAGEGKLAACDVANCRAVAGIISTDPAYLMNSTQEGVALALAGRVPCKVTGPVAAGDLIVSAGNGMAMANNDAAMGTVIGKAIEANESGEGVIEVLALMM